MCFRSAKPTILVRPPLRCGDCGLPFPPTIRASGVVPTDNIPLPFICGCGECPGDGDDGSGECVLRIVLLCLLEMVLWFNGAKCASCPCGVSFSTASGLASD